MSNSRLWVFGAIAVMLVVIVGGWTLGISPVLTQSTTTSAQLTTAQSSSQAAQIQLATLKTQFKNITKLKKKLNALRLSIPETQSASAFLTEVATAGAQSGVSLQTVTIASATLYASASATTAPAGAAATTSTATPSPSATAATTPVAPTTSTTTASGLILIPVIVTVKGSFEATREFADYMQTGSRLLVASGLSLSFDGTTATTTVTGDIFSLPGTSDAPAKSTTGSDSLSTSTPTPSTTPTSTPTPTNTPASTTNKSGSSSNSTAPTSTPTPTETPASP